MPEGKYFVIKSRLSGHVLDVKGGEISPQTQVIMWPRKEGEESNQVWVEDHLAGCIRPSTNDELCLTVNGECGRGGGWRVGR